MVSKEDFEKLTKSLNKKTNSLSKNAEETAQKAKEFNDNLKLSPIKPSETTIIQHEYKEIHEHHEHHEHKEHYEHHNYYYENIGYIALGILTASALVVGGLYLGGYFTATTAVAPIAADLARETTKTHIIKALSEQGISGDVTIQHINNILEELEITKFPGTDVIANSINTALSQSPSYITNREISNQGMETLGKMGNIVGTAISTFGCSGTPLKNMAKAGVAVGMVVNQFNQAYATEIKENPSYASVHLEFSGDFNNTSIHDFYNSELLS